MTAGGLAGELLVGVTADVTKAQKQIEDGLSKAGDSAGAQASQSFGSKMSGGIQKAALPATAALAGLAAAGVGAIKSAEGQIASDQKLAKVFEQMGYAENAAAAKAYADELQSIIGVDAAEIESAQAKLATFSDLASSQDLLARATRVAADSAAAGFGDMSSQSVGLGKALQDPLKGMSLLSKQGSLTKAEQKAIGDEFIKTGDKAKAQDSILAALEKQVGGVAEASASTSTKMALSFGEVAESIGMAAMPLVNALLPAVNSFSTWAQNNTPILIGVGAAVAAIAAAILVANAVIKIIAVSQQIWAAAQWALNAAMSANPLGLIIIAIVALVAAIVLAWKHSETFREVVMAVWDAIKNAVGGVVDWFMGTVWPTMQRVWDAIQKGVESLLGIMSRAWDAIKGAVDAAAKAIGAVIRFYVDAWVAVFKGLSAIVGWVVDAFTAAKAKVGEWLGNIRDWIGEQVSKVVAAFGAALNFIAKVDAAMDAVRSAIVEWIGKVASKVTDKVGSIVSAFGDIVSKVVGVGGDIVEGLWRGISGAWDWVMAKVRGLTDKLPAIVKKALGIGSPSKVFAGIGENIVAGLRVGLDDARPGLLTDMRTLIPTTLPTPTATLAPGWSGNPLEVTGMVRDPSTLAGAVVQVFIGDDQLDAYMVRVNNRQMTSAAGRLIAAGV